MYKSFAAAVSAGKSISRAIGRGGPSKWWSPKTLDFQGPTLPVALEKEILRWNAVKRIMFKNVEEMYRRKLYTIVCRKIYKYSDGMLQWVTVQLLRSSFYRKRLPQQNGDRRIGERETCMHLIVCRARVGARAFPSLPHAIRRRALCAMTAPPP